jgi:Phosphotransferase system cellobiose-specific component IIC
MAGKIKIILNRLITLLDKLDDNKYYSSIKETIVGVDFPLSIVGSIFYIAANPPKGTNLWLTKLWMSSALQVYDYIMVPYCLTLGMVALVNSFIFPFKLSKSFGMDPVLPSIASCLSFLCLCFTGGVSIQWTLKGIADVTGSNGVFLSFIISLAVVSIIRFLENKKVYFNMLKTSTHEVNTGFKNILPVFIIITISWVLGRFINIYTGKPLQLWTAATANSLAGIISVNSKEILSPLMASIMHFIGLDGELIHHQINNVFINQGGIVLLLPLSFLYLISYSRQLKQIGKAAIIPLLFNVPYPFVYGAALILNPLYLIPFILSPVICSAISFLIVSTGLVSPIMEASATMPFILSGFFSTSGNSWGVLLQVLNFTISAAIYYPFFKYHEKRLLYRYGNIDEIILSSEPFYKRLSILFVESLKRERSLFR